MRPAAALGAACAAVAIVVLAGCGSGGYVDSGGQSVGEELFTQRCGSCHVLADAGTAGVIGPNLDDAFAQARTDGMTSDTFTQVVAGQIRYPIENTSTGAPGMPGVDETLPRCEDADEDAFCVEDQDQAVADISVYVGAVAGTGATPPPAGDGGGDGDGGQADGASIFLADCGACHTLAAAGTTGTVGPNLDDSAPSRELTEDRVRNGRGAMPAFEGTLSDAQIEAVSEYVASRAGG